MRTFSKVASVLLSLFFLWNIYFYFTNRDTTEIVMHGSIRDIISCQAQVIKEEILIPAPADGVLQPYVADCEKSGKDMAVAAILNGETNEESKKKLTVLKSRISALEDVVSKKTFEDDLISIDNAIASKANQIISYTGGGAVTKVSEYKEDIIKLLDKRSHTASLNGEEILKKLDIEKKELESSLGNLINEVYSPVSGIFSARLDGLEEKYTPENLGSLTFSALEEINKTKPKKMERVSKGENVCKIINNFNWYLAAALDKKQIGDMEAGDSIKISFLDAEGETVNATVHSISEEMSGRHIVVFNINRDVGDVLSRRSVSVDIIRKTYEGFKIPMGALVYENDTTGVYVQKGTSRKFTPIEVLYHNDNYLIAKEDNQQSDSLLLYDSVVVNGDMN